MITWSEINKRPDIREKAEKLRRELRAAASGFGNVFGPDLFDSIDEYVSAKIEAAIESK